MKKSKSNNIWSDRFYDPLGGKIIFFESLSTIGIDWNKNLMMVVLPNKVFYGNDVVQRNLYLESRDKEGNSGGSGNDFSERGAYDDEHDEEAYVVNTQK